MGIQGKYVSFYFYGSFLWLQIFKYEYTGEWVFFCFFFWNLKFFSWIAPKHTTLILPKQSDFRSGDSCTNQLLSISHEILSVFDDSLEVRGVFLDISKAFGRVWHKGLLVTTKGDIGRSDYFNKMFLKL